jgi:hypothetical protein
VDAIEVVALLVEVAMEVVETWLVTPVLGPDVLVAGTHWE